jgi:excisionase family DNA binding protein
VHEAYAPPTRLPSGCIAVRFDNSSRYTSKRSLLDDWAHRSLPTKAPRGASFRKVVIQRTRIAEPEPMLVRMFSKTQFARENLPPRSRSAARLSPLGGGNQGDERARPLPTIQKKHTHRRARKTTWVPPVSVFTIEDLARYLRISPSTIYRLLKRNELPGFKLGRNWRFSIDAIDQWRQAQDLRKPK